MSSPMSSPIPAAPPALLNMGLSSSWVSPTTPNKPANTQSAKAAENFNTTFNAVMRLSPAFPDVVYVALLGDTDSEKTRCCANIRSSPIVITPCETTRKKHTKEHARRLTLLKHTSQAQISIQEAITPATPKAGLAVTNMTQYFVTIMDTLMSNIGPQCSSGPGARAVQPRTPDFVPFPLKHTGWLPRTTCTHSRDELKCPSKIKWKVDMIEPIDAQDGIVTIPVVLVELTAPCQKKRRTSKKSRFKKKRHTAVPSTPPPPPKATRWVNDNHHDAKKAGWWKRCHMRWIDFELFRAFDTAQFTYDVRHQLVANILTPMAMVHWDPTTVECIVQQSNPIAHKWCDAKSILHVLDDDDTEDANPQHHIWICDLCGLTDPVTPTISGWRGKGKCLPRRTPADSNGRPLCNPIPGGIITFPASAALKNKLRPQLKDPTKIGISIPHPELTVPQGHTSLALCNSCVHGTTQAATVLRAWMALAGPFFLAATSPDATDKTTLHVHLPVGSEYDNDGKHVTGGISPFVEAIEVNENGHLKATKTGLNLDKEAIQSMDVETAITLLTFVGEAPALNQHSSRLAPEATINSVQHFPTAAGHAGTCAAVAAAHLLLWRGKFSSLQSARTVANGIREKYPTADWKEYFAHAAKLLGFICLQCIELTEHTEQLLTPSSITEWVTKSVRESPLHPPNFQTQFQLDQEVLVLHSLGQNATSHVATLDTRTNDNSDGTKSSWGTLASVLVLTPRSTTNTHIEGGGLPRIKHFPVELHPLFSAVLTGTATFSSTDRSDRSVMIHKRTKHHKKAPLTFSVFTKGTKTRDHVLKNTPLSLRSKEPSDIEHIITLSPL